MGANWLQLAKYNFRLLVLRSPLKGMRPYQGARANLWTDLANTWRQRDLCVALAFQRSIARFRGTFLGPMWIALSFALGTTGLSFLWAYLFNRPLAVYMPYVTLGFLIWNVLLGSITDGARSLTVNKNLILQTRTPMTLYPAISLGTNIITFVHHIPFVVVVLILFPPHLGAETLLVVPGLLLAFATALGAGVALSIWCAYVPDLAEFIAVGQRFLMFFTPILWLPSQRPKLEPFLLGNPFYHMINVARGPVVGTEHLVISFCVMGALCVSVWMLASFIYWRAAGAVATRL